MKKIIISKLFLYKHRFAIGYTLLTLAFVTLLFLMPAVAQTGLSEAEINSATGSYYLNMERILHGDLVDLPYRLLQKVSIMAFGLTPYAIKLPSIIVGLFLGLLLVLLLGRWFKNNVSLLASCLIILSTPFLFLAGSGTPLIMLVFWPTLMLWLGSKIQGVKRPKPVYSFLFAIIMLLSVFTPFMIYFTIFCVIFVLCQPHLRFIIKNLPKLILVAIGAFIIAGFVLLGISVCNHPETIKELFLGDSFKNGEFFSNITAGLAPVFSWHNTVESVFLSPLISLPIFALSLIGLCSTTKGFFASRNSIATILLVFCLAITGFDQKAVIFFVLPLSILVAHGLKYLLEKWYGLFPENPYARISAIFPLGLLFAIILIPGLLQYIYGYHYNPNITDEFSYELEVIQKNLDSGTLVVNKNYDFYKILEASTDIMVVNQADESVSELAFLNKPDTVSKNYALKQIITSPMRENSDIIYIYQLAEKEGE